MEDKPNPANGIARIADPHQKDRIEGTTIFLNAEGLFPKRVLLRFRSGLIEKRKLTKTKNNRFQLEALDT